MIPHHHGHWNVCQPQWFGGQPFHLTTVTRGRHPDRTEEERRGGIESQGSCVSAEEE